MNEKTTKAKKDYKLNIFDALKQADIRNFDWYSKLGDEEKKGFIPLVFMRWMSSVADPNLQPLYLCMVNEYVNAHFWDLSKHPELIWKLMCVCGDKKIQKHVWLASKTKRKASKIDDFILSINPSINDLELDIIISRLTLDSLIEIAQNAGLDDDQIKDLTKEYKDRNRTD